MNTVYYTHGIQNTVSAKRFSRGLIFNAVSSPLSKHATICAAFSVRSQQCFQYQSICHVFAYDLWNLRYWQGVDKYQKNPNQGNNKTKRFKNELYIRHKIGIELARLLVLLLCRAVCWKLSSPRLLVALSQRMYNFQFSL